MTINPVHPLDATIEFEVVDQDPAQQPPAPRRTFGARIPSRRTFGARIPSRRTFGHNLP